MLTEEELLLLSDDDLDVAARKIRGDRVVEQDFSPEYGRGEYGENFGYYFYLNGSDEASNYSPYYSEKKAWQCWGYLDIDRLIDEMADNGTSHWFNGAELRFTIHTLEEISVTIPTKTFDDFARVVKIAYILFRQKGTVPC